jgi:glucans biosynthesis protein
VEVRAQIRGKWRPRKLELRVNRRQFLTTSAAVPVVAALTFCDGRVAVAQPAAASGRVPFASASVRQLAQQLAQKPYQAPDQAVPDNLKKLDYDQYRKIRYIPEKALWRGEGLPFQIQLFHRGFFYTSRVEIFEVADGKRVQSRVI